MWYSYSTVVDNSVQFNMAADSGMDTCPSPENPDSRKRPLDSDIENGTTKRSHYVGAGGDGMYHLKILVPCIASGAIIGKGGETIAQLQKDTTARVKMSKANDFYPGTSERVCLISGSVDAILSVLIFIMEKIKEKPELSGGSGGLGGGSGKSQPVDVKLELDVKVAERDKQVKILIPNSTAGMIIGKGGMYIKQIKEDSGSYVQISQKAKDQSLQERCITVIGEIESNKKACMMILAKVMEDPQSGSCLNVSYADIAGPVANYNPTGSPYAHTTAAASPSFSTPTLSNSVAVSQMMMNGGLGSGLNLSLNLSSPFVGANQSVTSQLIDNIKMVLHSRGYSEHATNEISCAMSTLAKYGILGMGLGINCTGSGSSLLSGSFLGVNAMDGTPAQANGIAAAAAAAAASSGVFGPIGTGGSSARSSLDLAAQFDPFRHATGLNNNTFGLGPAADGLKEADGKDSTKLELTIPEVIVGAILGPGGRALVEIQHISGANIQISKKGIYAPGTRSRMVTISGSLNAISTAQYLIEQRITEEEAKRTRHGSLSILQ